MLFFGRNQIILTIILQILRQTSPSFTTADSMNIQRCMSLAAGAKVLTVESMFLCQILKRWILASDSEVCIRGFGGRKQQESES